MKLIPSLIFAALITFVFPSCQPEGSKESENIEMEQIKAENERLKEERARKDSSINSLLGDFNRIQENLVLIKEKEGILTINASNPELEESNQEQIINDLQTINQLMAENREAVQSLNSKLRKSNIQSTELQKMLQGLQQQIEVRNAKISELQARLEQLDEAYRNLYTEYNARIEELDERENQLYSAWYAIGSSKELQEAGVITREGGFIGLGKADKLRSDFNTDYFTQININELREIPLVAKKVNIVTTHPASSYKLEEDEKGVYSKIVITDPELFWRASKYLVIILD